MVEAVRVGQSLRQAAKAFGVSVGTVAHWVEQARGMRIDRVPFANHKPGRAWNRTSARIGCIAWYVARSTSPINASVSMPDAGVNQPGNRSFARSLIHAHISSSKAHNECSVNAETMSHQRQKSVQSTLRFAH